MGVEGTASGADIIAAVKNAGYGAALKGAWMRSLLSVPLRLLDTALDSCGAGFRILCSFGGIEKKADLCIMFLEN